MRSRERARRREQYARFKKRRGDAHRATTRTPCSCWMCGNPRKHFGERTRQEAIANISFAEQLDNLTNTNPMGLRSYN